MTDGLDLLLVVNSTRLGGKFECHRFREYSIDLDLDTDADAFDVVFKNPNSVYTSLFSKFDMVEMSINGKGIMNGRIDIVNYIWTETDSYIRISGRDLAAALVDNDALPATLQNIKPHEYIAQKCTYYGIPFGNIDKSMKTIDKRVIGAGESEMSIISGMVDNENKKCWLDYRTFHVGLWDTGATPTYTFTRGVPAEYACIPIKTMDLEDNGLEVYSESIIYGSTGSGENKVVGGYKNNYMTNSKIHRRRISTSSNDDGTDKYKAKTEDDVRFGFDNSHTLEVTTGMPIFVKPNTTAWIIDTVTKINAVFFIKKVTYSKSVTEGSNVRISMIPGKKANDMMYAAQGTLNGGITGKASMTFDDLWKSKKG